MRRVVALAMLPLAAVALRAHADSGFPAREIIAVSTQNALVQKNCAVCHTDAAPTGGLSLEHFDAARVAPSLAAMMLSKVRS